MIKILTTLKELKSFCKKNKIKCVKDKEKQDRLCLTIPSYIYTISKSTYKKNFNYEINYFLDRFVITVYDCYYDYFNEVKTIDSWNNSQEQILGVLFLKNKYVLFTKSGKIQWDNNIELFGFCEFREEQNND